MKKRSITKESLDTLASTMPVISLLEMLRYMGGFDPNDCFWRCIAWFESCGTAYSEYDAYSAARSYYGNTITNYYGFIGTSSDANNILSEYFGGLSSSYCTGRILVFDPGQVINSANLSKGSSHAVVVLGYNGSNIEVFDPQLGIYYTVDTWSFNQSSGGFYAKVN